MDSKSSADDIHSVEVFLDLLKGGLWERSVSLSGHGQIDWDRVLRISKEQTVVGLVTAGIEHMVDLKLPKLTVLPFIMEVGTTVAINKQMNSYMESLFSLLDNESIHAVLIKGQGIAQCYERPLWRSSGDIDLLLNEDYYKKAKALLAPLAESVGEELSLRMHHDFKIEGWTIELHGTLHSDYLPRMNRVMDGLIEDLFQVKLFRKWHNGNKDITLPAPNYDVIFVFCHIIQHFFQGGIGLRQVCDWCRLLWVYRNDIDKDFLERNLREMKMLSEWKAFACVAVDYLGMEEGSMPLYDRRFLKKAGFIVDFIMKVGNFGRNRDRRYLRGKSLWKRKTISMKRQSSDLLFMSRIFPKDSILFFFRYFSKGIKDTVFS